MEVTTQVVEVLPPHAKYSPSSAERWMRCQEWLKYDYPNKTNYMAQRGTDLHALASDVISLIYAKLETYFARGVDPWEHVVINDSYVEYVISEVVKQEEHKHLAVDADSYFEHVELIRDYIKACFKPLSNFKEDALFVEYKLAYDKFNKALFGTMDSLVVHEAKGYADILDLKTGNIKVNPSSLQVKIYAWLVLQNYPKINLVNVDMYQYGTKQHGSHLKRDSEEYNWLTSRINDILSGKIDQTLASVKTCSYCPHMLNCQTFKQTFLTRGLLKVATNDLENLTHEEELAVIKAKDVILEFIKRRTEEKQAELMNANKREDIEAYIFTKNGRRVLDEELIKAEGLDVDDFKEVTTKLVTLTRAKRILKDKGLDAETLDYICSSNETETLVWK